ncbi:hypothetical protein IWQ57_005544 [Coemansia nantahalensis]|uniref:Uncharacterized protein n=1 Tax=Coemansia nantahalensis TaxID=2789366 RepID=A0ACC1JMU4_9FUNG|nr:hypothetical protein IWQ57_005544 [Coemansia nantahalensis]
MGSPAQAARVRTAVRLALVLAVLLAAPASAFTRTSTRTGTMTRTETRTSDGATETVTVTSAFTSYMIYMNDDGPMSSFAGVVATTTDRNGQPSTYISPVVMAVPTAGIQTVRPTDPTKTAGESHTGPQTKTATATSAGDDSNKQISIGPIVGGAVGGVLALAILGAALWALKRKVERKKQLEEHHREEMQLLAMELDGSFRPDKLRRGPFSDSSVAGDTHANGSNADDLASRYTGGTLSRNPPTLLEAYSSSAHPITIGTELTMDSQGRAGMPDGSPAVLDAIMPLRNSKVSEFYADLEWFPLVISESELMRHQGPSYTEDKALHNVASYIEKPSGQRGAALAGRATRRP